MDRQFPYTNLHDLNIDWILEIIKDFQEKYQDLDEFFQNMLNEIEEKGQEAITAINNNKDTAIESISEFLHACETTLQQITENSISAVTEQGTEEQRTISELGASIANQLTYMISTIPQTYQDALNQLQIINSILNEYYTYPSLVQGRYSATTPSTELVNTDKIVSTILTAGCAAKTLDISVLTGSAIILEIITYTGWGDAAVSHIHQISTADDSITNFTYTFDANTTYFTIAFAESVELDTSISPSDFTIKLEWHTPLTDDIENIELGLNTKVSKPVTNPNGTSGQVLTTNGDGTTQWSDAGTPTQEQIETAVSAFIEEHPQYVTTVEDNSLTMTKFSDALQKQTENGYYTPQMWGAYADGIHDDTDAILSAFNACKGTDKYFYAPPGTYKTTNGSCVMIFTRGNTTYSFDVIIEGSITNLEIRGNYNTAHNSNIYIHTVTNLTIRNLKQANVIIGQVTNFYLKAGYADKYGESAYNNFYGSRYRHIYIYGEYSGSWVNECNFWGMRIDDITIDGASYKLNNHRFYDVSLEGGTVNFLNCHDCYIRARGENGITVNDAERNWGNVVEATYSGTVAINSVPSFSGMALTQRAYFNYIKPLILDSITALNWYNADNDYSKNAVKIPAWTTVGYIYIKPTFYGLFTNSRDGTRKLRETISFFDADLNEYTPEYINSLSNRGVICQTLTYDSTTGHYKPSADSGGHYITIKPCSDIEWIRITIATGSGSSIVNGLHFYLFTPNTPSFFVVRAKPFSAASIPANTTYPNGTYIADSSGTTKGWIYTSSGWSAV